jgi:hypothetical protein
MSKIKVFFNVERKKYIADAITTKGNPIVGEGSSRHEAIGALLCANA